MRKELFVGLSLAAAALVVVLISGALDLELESVALLGAAMGAVVGLVPDRTAVARLGGFVGGFVFAWIGYFLRAALLPDTTGGLDMKCDTTVRTRSPTPGPPARGP